MNPTAEAERLDIDLFEGVAQDQISTTPSQPLVFNERLLAVSGSHAQDMAAHQSLSTRGSDGRRPYDRILDSAYSCDTCFANAENVTGMTYGGTFDPQRLYTDMHDSLFVNSGVEGRSNRINMLDPEFSLHFGFKMVFRRLK